MSKTIKRTALAAVALGASVFGAPQPSQAVQVIGVATMGHQTVISNGIANTTVYLNFVGGGSDVTFASGPFINGATLYCVDGSSRGNSYPGTNPSNADVTLFCPFFVAGDKTLTLRDAQHEYVFAAQAPAAAGSL